MGADGRFNEYSGRIQALPGRRPRRGSPDPKRARGVWQTSVGRSIFRVDGGGPGGIAGSGGPDQACAVRSIDRKRGRGNGRSGPCAPSVPQPWRPAASRPLRILVRVHVAYRWRGSAGRRMVVTSDPAVEWPARLRGTGILAVGTRLSLVSCRGCRRRADGVREGCRNWGTFLRERPGGARASGARTRVDPAGRG